MENKDTKANYLFFKIIYNVVGFIGVYFFGIC